jgi:spore coat polysaccharide biosynthesis protein SpsF
MIALIQARYSSSRFPGKVLSKLGHRTLLGWVIERLRYCEKVSKLVVATSCHHSDDSIVELCRSANATVFRGSLHNVAERLGGAIERFQTDSFVRISADSPMIDPRLVDEAIDRFESGTYDLVTNVQKRTFPKGQSVEVLSVETFSKVIESLHDPYDKEHVTSFYYKNPKMFKISNIESQEDLGHLQLSVDTKEDFLIMQQLVERVDPSRVTWQELVLELRALSGLEIHSSKNGGALSRGRT